MDFREGGTTIVHMRSPAFGDLYNTWEYREIVPLRRIEFIQYFSDQDGERSIQSISALHRRRGKARGSGTSWCSSPWGRRRR
jgi:uncharacterized protein YndB with AHSA1/START domain